MPAPVLHMSTHDFTNWNHHSNVLGCTAVDCIASFLNHEGSTDQGPPQRDTQHLQSGHKVIRYVFVDFSVHCWHIGFFFGGGGARYYYLVLLQLLRSHTMDLSEATLGISGAHLTYHVKGKNILVNGK